MSLHAHLLMLARYNEWANTRLYAAAARLSADEYHADRGVFFKSMHGTLNHLLVGDRAWLRRLTGTGEQPKSLNTELYLDLASLRSARGLEDERLIDLVTAYDDAVLLTPISYINMRGDMFTQPRAQVLAHLFNHDTHHRGQAHAILTGLGRAGPELDLVFYLRECG